MGRYYRAKAEDHWIRRAYQIMYARNKYVAQIYVDILKKPFELVARLKSIAEWSADMEDRNRAKSALQSLRFE